MNSNIWYHICVCFNGGGGLEDRFIYINNKSQTIGTYAQNNIGFPDFDTNMTGSVGRERDRNWRYFPGAVSQFRIYNGALSADQVNDIYRSQLPDHLLDHAVIALTVNDFVQADTRSSSSSAWGDFSMIKGRAPISSGSSIDFDRAKEQFLRVPSLELKCATNGGFTALAYVKFSDSPGNYERIFDFGDGPGVNNIYFGRHTTTNTILFSFRNGTNRVSVSGATIVSNQWTILGCRIRSDSMSIWQDGVESTTSSSTLTPSNRTSTKNYIGRNNWDAEDYFTGSMRGLLVWDRALSDEEMVVMSQWLRDTF